MQKFALLFSLLIIACTASSINLEEMNQLWQTWKTSYEKTYEPKEEAARFAIFVDNYKKITKFNAEGNSVKLALNHFSDRTGEEFKGLHASCAYIEHDKDFVNAHTHASENIEYPASVDWRQNGIVTPVKNQGTCGSCWTFSTTGALEGLYALKTGTLYSFSEQQIVDCDTGSNEGCNGGRPYLAMAYTAYYGIELENSYPYTGVEGYCEYNIANVGRVNSGYQFVNAYNMNALKQAIAAQPVSIIIEADQDIFQHYSSGVLQSGCGVNLDHAVLAVGYGPVGGVDAYIVKNSWSASWGDQGFIYLGTDPTQNSGAGVCGILSQPVVPY